MSQTALEAPLDLTEAINNLVTEDDEPVDNPFSEKQQRLLTEVLYPGWTPPPDEEHQSGPREFWAAANVGLFPSIHQTPLAPDVFLSLDVSPPENWHENRSYFFWEYGKGPEVVIEIVSNRKGGELGNKHYRYARMGVTYYVVFDPKLRLPDNDQVLRVFTLQNGVYRESEDHYLPLTGLGLALWQGVYEKKEDTYLRWCDRDGNLLPTGAERTALEAERAEREAERAAQAWQRASLAEDRAAREAEARQQAESELERLREELARLRQ